MPIDLKNPLERFFAYARARHQIHLDREAGRMWPWTKDPILREFKFTNVFRELDKTTAWFRQHVREPLRERPEVLLATVVFRMLNRIEVGEAVFCQWILDGSHSTAFDQFLKVGSTKVMKASIRAYCKKGPYVTGAYIITSPTGYNKLDGMMRVLDTFNKEQWVQPGGLGKTRWVTTAQQILEWRTFQPYSLQSIWEWLRQVPYLGTFHSYEIVTDLRHTALLSSAPDIMTWASVGPGCRRGLNRVRGRDPHDKSVSTEIQLREMVSILRAAHHDPRYWPRREVWPAWEMREVEHTLCEFDKYERVRLGEGRPRGVYRHDRKG